MSNYLTKEQVNQLNEKHGWFEFGDAQSDVSMAFAQDAIAMYLAATEAAKATGTAELPPSDGVIEFYEESGRIGRSWTESAWLEQTVRAYGQACAEAARQPAPVTEKKLSDTIKSVLTPEDFGILDPELAKRAINFSNAMVHQAALAATAAPVLSDEQILAQWGKCNEPQIIIDFARRVLAAATRSQPLAN